MIRKNEMIFLQRLKQKIKYNNILRLLHDGLVKISINITFFYLVEEGLHLKPDLFDLNGFEDYSSEFLKENNLDIICSIPERPYQKEILINRLKNGCGCLLAKKNGKVIGYTWFDLTSCNFGSYKFTLKENEAYLFDAYVIMEHRGKKVAPFIRYQCYKELEKIDKTILYSISDLLNNQSIRFKKKLNAKFLQLILYVFLFNKLKFSRQIKKLA